MAMQNRAENFARFMGYEKLDVLDWLYGLAAAVIGGGANAVVGGITINMIDPKHFNAGNFDFYKLVAAMFMANAVISLFMYLKQKPLPAMRTVATHSEVAVPEGPERSYR